jgi:predicted ATP-dependent endonuclease of OLD family
MQIEIRHLGAIDKASINLRPLTVFIGENGTGKTWTAYTLEAIFGAYGHEQYLKAYLNRKTQQTYPPLDKASTQLLKEGYTQFEIIPFVSDYIEIYLNEVARLAPSWMQTRMNTKRVSFEKLQVQIELADDMKSTLANQLMATAINEKHSIINGSLNAVKEAEDSTLYVFSEGDILDKLPRQTIQQFLVSQLFNLIRTSLYSKTFKFSVDRVNEASVSVNTDSEKVERLLVELGGEVYKKLSYSDIPEAILKVLLGQLVAQANAPKLTDSAENSKYRRLAEFLENDILRGSVDFEDAELGKELIFQVKNAKLEMSVSSSMIRKLAPLVVYLRYHATPNNLIVLDEPEMNLHPAVQVELTEFLAMLVNAGLHVLITTHSPYIVDHIGNLMQAARHDNKESLKELFYLEQTDAFIPQEQVSIYLFEEGTTRNIVDDKGMIDWSTFGNVSSDVSDIYPQVLITD